MCVPNTLFAQNSALTVHSFKNQYLANPAMAGIDSGLIISMSYHKQMLSIPGSPTNQIFSGEYRFNRVGLGLHANIEKTGLVHQLRTVITYAYHLPLSMSGHQLHFGISVGFLSERIYEHDIVGGVGDLIVASFNDRKSYIDGDFGISYTTPNWTIQASIPNMKTFFKKDFRNSENQAIYFSALSYKFYFGESENRILIEPKISYYGLEGLKNIWDIGSNISLANNKLSAIGIYNNIGCLTFGFGILTLNNSLNLFAVYTTEAKVLQQTSKGNLGIGVRYKVL